MPSGVIGESNYFAHMAKKWIIGLFFTGLIATSQAQVLESTVVNGEFGVFRRGRPLFWRP